MKIQGRPNLDLLVTISLTETEARALDALAGYSIESFLQVFYHGMGEAYLKPHEEGLRSLFKAIRDTSGIGVILSRMTLCREAWDGTKLAVKPVPDAKVTP